MRRRTELRGGSLCLSCWHARVRVELRESDQRRCELRCLRRLVYGWINLLGRRVQMRGGNPLFGQVREHQRRLQELRRVRSRLRPARPLQQWHLCLTPTWRAYTARGVLPRAKGRRARIIAHRSGRMVDWSGACF